MGRKTRNSYTDGSANIWSSDISVTETITETEIIDHALTETETETMLIYETEIL